MEDIMKRRAGFELLGQRYEPADSVKIEKVTLAGIECFWFTPRNAKENRILIYVHGGAFAVGSIKSHGNMVSHFAKAFKLKILFAEYALAPEHPYPAGVNDIIKVYRQLLQDHPNCQFDIAGESAGGGVIISALRKMVSDQIKLPSSAVLISPWVNLLCDYPSAQRNNGLDIISTDYLKSSAADYIGDVTPLEASPEEGSFFGYPPSLILAGTKEILLDDAKMLHKKMTDEGIQSELILYDDQVHNWPLANIHSDASVKLLKDINDFLNHHQLEMTLIKNKIL